MKKIQKAIAVFFYSIIGIAIYMIGWFRGTKQTYEKFNKLVMSRNKYLKCANQNWKLSQKHLKMFLLCEKWLLLKQKGMNIGKYLVNNGYRTIAIYGMGYVGKCLVRELEYSNICIKYGIDKNAKNIHSNIKIYTMEDNLEEVDIVIITSNIDEEKIKKHLKKKENLKGILLGDIIDELIKYLEMGSDEMDAGLGGSINKGKHESSKLLHYYRQSR